MKYDIIIPHLGITEEITLLCAACLKSIAAYSKDYRVIFVDNGSSQFNHIWPELAKLPHLLVRNVSNAGFINATNQGIWLSTAPYVIMMNNDTMAVATWLERLCAPFADASERIGITGPRTTTQRSWQGRAPAGAGWRILPPNAMLAFFCTMFRREVFETVGTLDSSYGVGLGDDDDYCRRAQARGWKLALAQDLVIPHRHRTTFHTLYSPAEVLAMQERALAHFHSGDPKPAASEATLPLNPSDRLVFRSPVKG